VSRVKGRAGGSGEYRLTFSSQFQKEKIKTFKCLSPVLVVLDAGVSEVQADPAVRSSGSEHRSPPRELVVVVVIVVAVVEVQIRLNDFCSMFTSHFKRVPVNINTLHRF